MGRTSAESKSCCLFSGAAVLHRVEASVLVSPSTRKTETVIFSATGGLLVNHCASAQLCSARFASALPALAFSSTSKNGLEAQVGDLGDRQLVMAADVVQGLVIEAGGHVRVLKE